MEQKQDKPNEVSFWVQDESNEAFSWSRAFRWFVPLRKEFVLLGVVWLAVLIVVVSGVVHGDIVKCCG